MGNRRGRKEGMNIRQRRKEGKWENWDGHERGDDDVLGEGRKGHGMILEERRGMVE